MKSGTGTVNGQTNTSAWFNNRTINLQGTYEDDGSGIKYVKYQIDSASEKSIPSEGTYNTNITLADNITSATLKIWAVDAAGNELEIGDAGYKSYSLKLDTTAPTITIDGDDGSIK